MNLITKETYFETMKYLNKCIYLKKIPLDYFKVILMF